MYKVIYDTIASTQNEIINFDRYKKVLNNNNLYVQSLEQEKGTGRGKKKWISPKGNRNIPPLNYEKVYSIKNDFPNLEIIINGGIKSIREAKNHLNYVDGVMLGRAAYDNPFMLSEIDSEIYSNTKTDISRKDLLSEYLDYVHLMTEKGYDPKIMLKHVFGLKKGEKDAKRFRVKVTEVMRSPSLVENKDELLSMV